MSDGARFEAPIIADADICWVSRLLKLPDNAFYGEDRNDPRQKVLKSEGQLDIAACPGSGKTTLLVAKLAILAQKWRYRTRGLCVLSHTNVARNQIETQLGNTAAGRILLTYPHYIGTIHGFVNDFLALPWLRSIGYPIKMIDSEICELRRWNKLHYRWRSALEKRYVGKFNIRILDSNFNLGKRDGPFPFAPDTSTYQNLQKASQETAREGYHCYDDMFIWADDMMNKCPYIVGTIRDRFQLLFVDEAQDNSEEQSLILYRIFMNGHGTVIRQRFGDENQAIFDSIGMKEANKDKFPVKEFRLSNSHRFGSKIAQLVDPLGVIPYGLKGHGPKKPLASGLREGQHTIFLFSEDRIEKVLDAYAELLIETFSEEELVGGTFTAVGQIHRQPDKIEKQKFPHFIGHYWPDYDPELTRSDPRPKTFVEYVSVGMTSSPW
jgi:DNA helicase-2/ATP-dependent DNA helicase PcrA